MDSTEFQHSSQQIHNLNVLPDIKMEFPIALPNIKMEFPREFPKFVLDDNLMKHNFLR